MTARLGPMGLAGLATLMLLAGCAGGGRVELVALNFEAIDPPAGPAPRVNRLELDQCFWWLDEQGHVWVAMQREQRWPVGPDWRFRFQLSFALGEPPAGKARDFRISRREFRAAARFGPSQSRWESVRGIVALYREPGDRLRGSFRLQVTREVQRPLGDWGHPAAYLMLGTFTAVHDEAHGRRIAEGSELPGHERRDPEAQAPATRPALPTTPPDP